MGKSLIIGAVASSYVHKETGEQKNYAMLLLASPTTRNGGFGVEVAEVRATMAIAKEIGEAILTRGPVYCDLDLAPTVFQGKAEFRAVGGRILNERVIAAPGGFAADLPAGGGVPAVARPAAGARA